METNLITPSWGSKSGRKGGLADTRVYKEVAMAKLTTKQKPNLFVTAMGVYERVGARPRPGGGRAPTLGRARMGSNMIHGPTGQNRATQHLDRFWTSTSFDDSHRPRYYFDMRLVPLEALSNYLSNDIKNVPNGVRMRSWRPLQLCLVMQSESSAQNVLALISFHLWAKSDVVAWWRTCGTPGLGPQSTSLVIHAFHVCWAPFLIHVSISENDNQQTS
jgi:hypothetical protein